AWCVPHRRLTMSKKSKKVADATKKTTKKAKAENLSALDAAAQVLKRKGEPMRCKEMIEAMAKAGLWTSPGGQAPHATLYSAILREIGTKKREARFKKTERGHFTLN